MTLSKFGHHIAINVNNSNKFTVTEDIDVKHFKITNVKLPEHGSDATNKQFVDNYLKDFYNGVSDSLQSIIDNSNKEYILLKKSIENLKNQNSYSNKNIKAVDTNFKWLKQQVTKLEKELKTNVIKIQNEYNDLVIKTSDNIKNNIAPLNQQLTKFEKDFKNNANNIQKNYKDLTNKTNNIQIDVTQFKKHQDDIFIKKEKDLNDIFQKLFNANLDHVQRIDNLEKNLKTTEKVLDKETINTALNTSFFKAKFDEIETKSDDFKVQLGEFRKAVVYYEKQMIANNAQYLNKLVNLETRIENLEKKSIP